MNFKAVESKKLDNIRLVTGERYYAAYYSNKKEKVIKPLLTDLL